MIYDLALPRAQGGPISTGRCVSIMQPTVVGSGCGGLCRVTADSADACVVDCARLEPHTQDQEKLPQEGPGRAHFRDFTAVAALGTATESLKLLTDQFFNGGLRLVDRVQRRAQACDRVTPGAASRLCLQRCQVSARIHLPPVWIEQS